MNTRKVDPFGARRSFMLPGAGAVSIYRLSHFAEQQGIALEKLPYSIRVVLEFYEHLSSTKTNALLQPLLANARQSR